MLNNVLNIFVSRRSRQRDSGFTLIEAVIGLVLMAAAAMMTAYSISSSRTRMFETDARLKADEDIRSCMNEIVMLYEGNKGSSSAALSSNPATNLSVEGITAEDGSCPSCRTAGVTVSINRYSLSGEGNSYALESDDGGPIVEIRVSGSGASLTRLFAD